MKFLFILSAVLLWLSGFVVGRLTGKKVLSDNQTCVVNGNGNIVSQKSIDIKER